MEQFRNQPHRILFKVWAGGGAWVPQLVKRQTLDFGLGHDLTVCKFEPHVMISHFEFEPRVGLCTNAQSLLGILSLPVSPSAPPLLTLSLSK